jgi:hypothetical protein
MKKKYLVLIASIISSIDYHIESITHEEKMKIAELFNMELSKLNPLYDELKFMGACKGKERKM